MTPYYHIRGDYQDFQIMGAIYRGELPKKPHEISKTASWLWQICESCWNTTPRARISAERAKEITSDHVKGDGSKAIVDSKRGTVSDMYSSRRTGTYVAGGLGVCVSLAAIVYRSR